MIRIAQQSEDTIANQVRSGLLPANHCYDRVGDHFILSQPIPCDPRIHERTNQAVPAQVSLAHGGTKICRHLFRGLHKLRHSVGILLEVPQYLREILRPQLKLAMICNRQTQHLGGYDGRQRLGQVGDHIHASVRLHLAEQIVHDLANMRPQSFDPLRSKGRSSQAANTGVRRRIQKEHLLHHHLGYGVQRREPDLGEIF